MVSVQESGMDEIPLQEEETTMEYRVMMAYAQRTMPASKYHHLLGKTPSGQGAEEVTCNGEGHRVEERTPRQKDKKKSLRKWLTPQCLRAPSYKRKKGRHAPEDMWNPCAVENPDLERTKAIAHRLQDIIQRITKRSREDGGYRCMQRACSVEADGDGDDELIANIVEILRSSGDALNEQLMKEKDISQKLQSSWSYGFFRKLADYYLCDSAPASGSEYQQQTSKIALCIHATTKLTALDNQPMNKVLGFGVRYLQENYTPWIHSQGGWEKVMGVKEEEEEEVE
ncbi:apoptosis facilitator Bcl-2-like protein 14 [Pseudophryne corroboree]|uniref:apoptosis facilitator Bcl-2-like protein 14 n=1 Tax=Pseudophryne corroboree TaxID=495146 RepID=UPI003081E751